MTEPHAAPLQSRPIGLAVVGIGVAAKVIHIPTIMDSPDFELRAISDTDTLRLEALRVDGIRRYRTLGDLAADASVDAVIVCTPPDSHFDIARTLIAGGKHVLVEKPLTRTAAEGEELVRLAQESGVQLRVAHERRFQPTCQRIRSIIQAGWIGKPFYCGVHWGNNVKLDPSKLAPAKDAGGGFIAGYLWRWSNPNVGGGVLQDHIPHYVDLVRDWTDQEPISVYAETKNVARDFMGWKPEASRWDDLGITMIRFSEGLTLRLEVSVVGRVLSPLWHSGTGVGEWTEYGYVLGTEGQLIFDFLMIQSSENGRIAVWRRSEAGPDGIGWSAIEQSDPDRAIGLAPGGAAKEMFMGQLAEFGKAVRGLPNRSPSGMDGVITVAATEAAYRSAQSGQSHQITVQHAAV